MPQRIDTVSDDFVARPWTYPGTPPPGSGLLDGARFHRLTPDRLDRALTTARAAPVRDRCLVVAVGSNASPAVLLRKLAAGEVDSTVPFVAAEVVGLRVGHSAHVSRAGYIAAAPIAAPAARTSVTAILLDDRQLQCLDHTEPNYVRRSLGHDMCHLTLAGGEAPASFQVYVTTRGVLAPPGGPPVDLMDQERVYARLRRDCAPFALLLTPRDERAAMRRFAEHEHLRERAVVALQHAGWVTESGY